MGLHIQSSAVYIYLEFIPLPPSPLPILCLTSSKSHNVERVYKSMRAEYSTYILVWFVIFRDYRIQLAPDSQHPPVHSSLIT